ncbi:MAG: hypothetical protein B9S32_04410 [Verrucomicrobia bacterium Tous-C9LFEB]|nr:MAG: hypothetical protein B9S32_04410 [Verrucomicrobia bacterium Tous-C9LFEB]
MSTESTASRALDQGDGIVRFAPNWVPRFLSVPGKRLRLHPDDYYTLGAQRGGISERWFASTMKADNGPLTAPNEGLSEIVMEDGGSEKRILFRDAVSALKQELIGETLWQEHGGWPMYSKLFDTRGAIPFHIHHRDCHAKLVDQIGKHESYYYPPQLNNHSGDFPYAFFGFDPGTTKAQVRDALVNFSKGDNKILNLSRAYKLEPGTGWDVPTGILHAPGSLCTYEPQRNSDVRAVYQSLAGTRVISEEMLWRDSPPEKRGDYDYLIEVLDWEANIDSQFFAHHFMPPLPVRPLEEMIGFVERWICYRSPHYSAKELTINPGQVVPLSDAGAYGFIVVQGHGKIGKWKVESPGMIRYGQLTCDEFFVSAKAARDGVVFVNESSCEPLVILKHFGPANPELKTFLIGKNFL